VKPRLSSKARVRPDPRDGQPVLLSPERGLRLAGTAASIVALCDGTREVEEIVSTLCARYSGADRAQVDRDVRGLLGTLHARGLLEGWSPNGSGDDGSRDAKTPETAPGEAKPADRPAAPAGRSAGPDRATAGIEPYTLVAELTHRCPLACPYCSNPLNLVRGPDELRTEEWTRVIDEAVALGVMQVHLTGGEPLARGDLEAIAGHARRRELYVNLVTSGIPLERERLERLAPLLDHVQLSVQDADPASSDAIAGLPSFAAKMRVAGWIKALGLPMTLNVVLHRANLDRIEGVVALAEQLGADRLELANVQLVSWALRNESEILPTRAQIDRARVVAHAAKERLKGRVEVVFVLPDWHAGRPRACMDGWGRRFVVVAPDGAVLPCHAARSLPYTFESVRDAPLARIWSEGAALRVFRGEDWMPDPCRGCDHKAADFGGCRCQAFALTGDPRATDPACSLAPAHGIVLAARERAERSPAGAPRFVYRGR
jgi:pyrroloquinoline quinone biosynthesis protein E